MAYLLSHENVGINRTCCIYIYIYIYILGICCVDAVSLEDRVLVLFYSHSIIFYFLLHVPDVFRG